MSGPTVSDRAQAMLDDRLAMAREVIADQAWDRIELPAWVRERWPGIDLTDPTTLPEPDRCAEGRPWGVDAYGSAWGSLDQRWHAYLNTPGGRRCRNRWRDRDTLLCGTHLNAWHTTLDEAAKRLRRHAWQQRATELCRRLAEHGVEAEPNVAGLLVRPADADALAELLDTLTDRTTRTPAPDPNREA